MDVPIERPRKREAGWVVVQAEGGGEWRMGVFGQGRGWVVVTAEWYTDEGWNVYRKTYFMNILEST